ncbi:hypothetical protein ID866_13340, partial [Astraeus odoratus]
MQTQLLQQATGLPLRHAEGQLCPLLPQG